LLAGNTETMQLRDGFRGARGILEQGNYERMGHVIFYQLDRGES
jgi:hypothetical protein